jgi:1-acyl-sn-glycerol-3-phosphate acyltransferase
VLRHVTNWFFTLPFLLAFSGTLLLFDPLQRIARLFGQRPQEIVAGYLQLCLVHSFRITGMRLVVEKSPRIAKGGSYLFISNHQSLLDIPIVGATLFTNYPKYVAKRELVRWLPSISYNLRRGGNATIERRDRSQALRAIEHLAQEAQRRHVSAVIYPEGTRSRNGALRPVKKAGTLTLMRAAPKLPLVAVTVDGAWELLRHNLWPVPFGVKIRLHIADPIARSEDEDPDALFTQAWQSIEAQLEKWRSQK